MQLQARSLEQRHNKGANTIKQTAIALIEDLNDYGIFQFVVVSIVITFVMEILPDQLFNHQSVLFREKGWERHGEVYNRVFRVKKWKDHVFELNSFIKSVFPKKHIQAYSREYLEKYLAQSCKAEFTHMTIIVATFFYISPNETVNLTNMLILANMTNMPFIIIQRYNRPRIVKHLRHLNSACTRQPVTLADTAK